MTFADMVAEILSWRFQGLPDDLLTEIFYANAQEREFAPDARGLRRIWKEMKRSERSILIDDYDGVDKTFGPERQAVMSAMIAKAVAFEKDMFTKSSEEVAELYAEVAREHASVFNELRSEFDREAFFSEPEADADFSVWMQMPIWSVNEATALSLGKSPELVNPKSMKAIKERKSNFGRAYTFRRTAIKRAVRGGHLKDPMPRGDFIRWAVEHQMTLPEPLAKVSMEMPGALSLPPGRIVSRERTAQEAAGARREENSLHKIIAGMAVKHYKCGNEAMFSRAVNDIVSHVLEIGHNINDDTVRKHLRMALKLPAK